MVSEDPRSNLLDPLNGHFGPSLFPRTIRASTTNGGPNPPTDVDSVHDFMKSVGLKSPHKLLEKAKSIICGGSEIPNSNFASSVAVMDNKENAVKGKEKPQERRPGLGRKRPQFSFKPSTSQPTAILEPTLDIDKLPDPVEFFLEYEKLENAKKEIRRQSGVRMTGLNEYNSSMNPRQRRPGILGYKRPISYKHRYSSVLSENNDSFTCSQESLGQEIRSPPNPDLPEETTELDVETQEGEVAGSLAKTENRVNKVLLELLSTNTEDLDGDGALSLLQERLQIKPLDLGKLCLPDFHDIRKTDFMTIEEKLPRPRKSLLEMHTLVKDTSGKTPTLHKKVTESPMILLSSPTPPRSPFASIPLLKKWISQSNPSRDPFSPLNVDPSSSRNSSSAENIDKQSGHADTLEEFSNSGKLKSPLGDEITRTTAVNIGLRKGIIGGSIHLADKSLYDSSSMPTVGIDIRPSGSHGDLEGHNESKDMDDRIVDYSVKRPNNGTDVQANGPYEVEVNVEDLPQQAVSTVQPPICVEDSTMPFTYTSTWMYGSPEMDDNVEDLIQWAASSAQPDAKVEVSAVENLNSGQSQLDKSIPPAVESHDMDVPSTTSEIGPEQHIKMSRAKHTAHKSIGGKAPRKQLAAKNRSGTSLDEQNKAKRPREQRQRKALSHWQSVADSGTSLESGVRRSKRINMRPLEYHQCVDNKKSTPAVGDHDMDVPSTTSDVGKEQHIEDCPDTSLNKQKAKRPRERLRTKSPFHRQSLADAGTFFQSGIRRSKRIKMRPLEYWKGERFLYGRIHNSLTTVIGLKYASPAKGDGKLTLKIKSYVSDEYRELVELAALH